MAIFVQMISSKLPNILLPFLVLRCIIWVGVHAKRLICYFQGRGHCKSSYDQNKTISTVSFELLILFATKLGLIVHYYKKLDCCVQGQGHSKISKCRWMFVDMIFSESLNLFATELGKVMHHYEPDSFSKRWVCCFQGQGHS